MNWLQSFFNTPARQALGWTFLGLFGIAMAAGGIWFLTEDGGGGRVADADDSTAVPTSSATATATRSATATASPTATPSPSLTPTETAVPTATTRPAVNTGASTGGGAPAASAPEPTATPEPTEPPVVGTGAYCPPTFNGQPTIPSGRIAGAVTIGGVDAAAGTVDVFIAFDGVLGPSVKNVDGAFRLDFYANTSACANHVGAAISAYANGQYFGTGRSVGDGAGQLIPVTVALP
jgi:cytoskeletal protein RodZ